MSVMTKINKYDVDTSLYYDPAEHFWVKITGDRIRIGMSPLIQESSGAFVAVQMNALNKEYYKGEAFWDD